MKQKAFILTTDNLEELQKLLDGGWTVLHSCPMPNSISTTSEFATKGWGPTCFILLQK